MIIGHPSSVTVYGYPFGHEFNPYGRPSAVRSYPIDQPNLTYAQMRNGYAPLDKILFPFYGREVRLMIFTDSPFPAIDTTGLVSRIKNDENQPFFRVGEYPMIPELVKEMPEVNIEVALVDEPDRVTLHGLFDTPNLTPHLAEPQRIFDTRFQPADSIEHTSWLDPRQLKFWDDAFTSEAKKIQGAFYGDWSSQWYDFQGEGMLDLIYNETDRQADTALSIPRVIRRMNLSKSYLATITFSKHT